MAAIAGAAALLAASAPADAAGCWRAGEASAARIREFQSMLMVETLRCRSSGMDISDDYDRFVIAKRAELKSGNAALHAHFGAGDMGAADYDRFATSLANAYGSGGAKDAGCDAAAALERTAAAAASVEALLDLAVATVPARDLPGGICPVAPAAPVTIAAAEPVTLPPQLVAALETIAALTRRQAVPPSPPEPAQVAERVASAAP